MADIQLLQEEVRSRVEQEAVWRAGDGGFGAGLSILPRNLATISLKPHQDSLQVWGGDSRFGKFPSTSILLGKIGCAGIFSAPRHIIISLVYTKHVFSLWRIYDRQRMPHVTSPQ